MELDSQELLLSWDWKKLDTLLVLRELSSVNSVAGADSELVMVVSRPGNNDNELHIPEFAENLHI